MRLSPEELDKRAKRREVLPAFFIVILVGIAYQEMVTTVRESVRLEKGFTFATVVLFSIFFLTAMRFFVGDQLHLQSEEMRVLGGPAWFTDLMVIVLQMTMVIFLGGLTSRQANAESPVGFFGLLIALYALDVLWILSQAVLKQVTGRQAIPWQWGILNSLLIASMVITYFAAGGFYSNAALAVLGGLNLLGFVIDMIIIDRYGML